MKITNKVTELVEKEEVVDIICNMCGQSLSNFKRIGHPHLNYHGIQEICITAGFDSDIIRDGNSIKFSICEHCLMNEIVPKFKIQPQWKNSYTEWCNSKEEMDKQEQETYEALSEIYKEEGN